MAGLDEILLGLPSGKFPVFWGKGVAVFSFLGVGKSVGPTSKNAADFDANRNEFYR